LKPIIGIGLCITGTVERSAALPIEAPLRDHARLAKR